MDGLIYAYHTPKSTAQQRYTAERLRHLTEERKLEKSPAQQERGLLPPHQGLFPAEYNTERQRTSSSRHSDRSSLSRGGPMETLSASSMSDTAARSSMAASTLHSHSSHSEISHLNLLAQPFEIRHGRRYLREVPYPLPCDLVELQRQNLRTLLGCTIFGRAVCSQNIESDLPKKVLEIGCGSGYWSAMCHDYFSSLGKKDVAFTGLDLAPLAPNLRAQGVHWQFVQHDIRRVPWPFDDGEFDLVMIKDMSLAIPQSSFAQRVIDESMRILRGGGTLEIWASDHTIRSLLPHPPPPPSPRPIDQDIAEATATFQIAPGTPFAPTQNKYIRQANRWLDEALSKRRLSSTPCARIAQLLFQETNSLYDINTRRIAIPLSELRWERDAFAPAADSPMSGSRYHPKGKSRATSQSPPTSVLTAEQLALRQTALMTVLQQIESLEPLMMEASGKNCEEWSRWWAGLMRDLTDVKKNALAGEALEMGAWWAMKVEDSDDDEY